MHAGRSSTAISTVTMRVPVSWKEIFIMMEFCEPHMRMPSAQIELLHHDNGIIRFVTILAITVAVRDKNKEMVSEIRTVAPAVYRESMKMGLEHRA